jgi:hypothetical protein
MVASVSKTCLVNFDGNKYSVMAKVGQQGHHDEADQPRHRAHQTISEGTAV